MPTERFYNLPEGKRRLIIEAIVEEFTRVPFEKASINKIIKTAGISRGSFYTYFEDKTDVLECLFEEGCEKFQNGWLELAGENNGDLWKTSEAILSYSMENTKENVLQLIKNIVDSKKMYGMTHQLYNCKLNKENPLHKIMYQSINTSDFKDQRMENFGRIVTMIFFEVAHCMGWYYHHPEDKEKIKEIFREKLEILQYGIRKQSLQS